jgi:hypothetical protein
MQLPLMHKLFLLLLAGVSIYIVFSGAAILLRLRSLVPVQSSESDGAQRIMAVLHYRSAKMRQLIAATFYLFGLVFFLGLRFALYTPESKSVSVVGFLVLQNFYIYFAFAANAFSIFLVLHSIQWFVSGRLQARISRVGYPGTSHRLD